MRSLDVPRNENHYTDDKKVAYALTIRAGALLRSF